LDFTLLSHLLNSATTRHLEEELVTLLRLSAKFSSNIARFVQALVTLSTPDSDFPGVLIALKNALKQEFFWQQLSSNQPEIVVTD